MHPRRPGLVIFDQILERTFFALEMALRSTLVILVAGSESIAVLILQHRSDNGPEFVAKAVQEWIAVVGAKTAYIERGSPFESFNARLRDELLNGEIFYTLREAQIVIESWRFTTTRSGPTPQSDTSHQHQSRAFIRRVAGCATPTCWTTQRGLIIICAKFCFREAA